MGVHAKVCIGCKGSGSVKVYRYEGKYRIKNQVRDEKFSELKATLVRCKSAWVFLEHLRRHRGVVFLVPGVHVHSQLSDNYHIKMQ